MITACDPLPLSGGKLSWLPVRF